MAERDYANDYDDWMRDTGGDPAYGGTIPTNTQTGAPYENPDSSWLDPWLVLNPPYAAPAGQTWVRNPQTGVWELQGSVPGTNNVPWTPPGGESGPPPPIDYGSIPTTYGSSGGAGGFDYGRPPGMLPFTPYQSFSFSPFSYGDFTPTNRDDLWDDSKNPGFANSMKRLRAQIEGGAAGRGMLFSRNTLEALGSILGNNEAGEFKAFDDRRFRDWSANRANQFGAWEANTGLRERDNQRANDFRFNTEKASFDDILSRWDRLMQSTTQLAMPPG